MIGEKFTNWTVVSRGANSPTTGKIRLECICVCGERRLVVKQNLKNGTSISCGCKNRVDPSRTVLTCGRCKRPRSIDEFSFNKRAGRREGLCKSCRAVRCREWNEKNREERRRINREYALRHPKRVRECSNASRLKAWKRNRGYKLLLSARSRCKNQKAYRHVKFLLSEKEIKTLATAFNRATHCPLCSKIFTRGALRDRKSYDRKDSLGHYEIRNVQIICFGCNSTKDKRKGSK